MLYTVSFMLLGLWMVGLATRSTIGGLIHLLLIVALVLLILNFVATRRRIAADRRGLGAS